MKTYEVSARVLVFARVYVIAESETEALLKAGKGGGWWDSVDFEKHTGEMETLESIKEQE